MLVMKPWTCSGALRPASKILQRGSPGPAKRLFEQNACLLVNCSFAFVVNVQWVSVEVPWLPKAAAEMKGGDFE